MQHVVLFIDCCNGRLKSAALVRERLWQRTCEKMKGGAAIMIWTTNNEQGFQIQFWGETARWPTDWEGLQLITRPRERVRSQDAQVSQ
ncbi:type I-E CRISPR-associated endoribonuclease Cas2 [bacterium]|nr:type I-E CRISPR-associated endoribonuclease Cas2 [bacterium]